jgi:Raf kinase inhibitor-like YbhB/YbcL family protein
LAFELYSPAFKSGETIPRRYTADGEDLSPPLNWTQAPAGTQAFALICDDPDAPRGEPWLHWLAYDLPATLAELPEALPTNGDVREPVRFRQGRNSWEKTGYGGPAPPRKRGVHHYIFTLHALAQPTALPAGVGKAEVLKVIEGHVLASATLVGLYER